MKLKLFTAGIGVALVMYSVGCTSLLFFPDKSKNRKEKEALIQTNWKQMGGFEKYTPDKLRVGCWSTALAQIAYYHQLKPFGKVQYTSRKGYAINEQLDSTALNFGLFTAKIDSTTPRMAADQLAKYSYYAALVVQKDFGTDRYINKLAPASLLEQHYDVSAQRYICWKKSLPYTLGKLEQIIFEELNNARPVFLHFANLKDFGHSAVIDGYYYRNGRFMIHLNQGQGGPTDGWYDFHKGILRPDDNALRVVYTIKPSPSRPHRTA